MDFNIQPALSLTVNSQQKPHKTPEQANQVPQILSQDSDTTVSKQPLAVGRDSTSEKLTLVPGSIRNRYEKIKQNLNKKQHPQDTPKVVTVPKHLSDKSTVQKDIGLKRQTEQNQIDTSTSSTPQITNADNGGTLESTSNVTNAPTNGSIRNRYEKIKQNLNKKQHPQDTPKVVTVPKHLSDKSTVQKDIGLKRQTEQNQIDSVGCSSVPTTPQLTKKKIKEGDNGERLESIINVGNK